jgi:hypothetical protein
VAALRARTAAASAHRVPVAQLYRERLPTKTAFVEGLRALDYVEGQTIEVHYRYADGDTTKLVALGRQLVALQPAVALATTISPAIAHEECRARATYCVSFVGRGCRAWTRGKFCAASRQRDRLGEFCRGAGR